MKAVVFVVALVLLCGCYAGRFKSGNTMFFKNKADRAAFMKRNSAFKNKVSRDEASVQLKKLPCTFSMTYEGTLPHLGNIKGEYKRYAGNEYGAYWPAEGKNVIHATLYRVDIPSSQYALKNLLVASEIVQDVCEVDYDYVYPDETDILPFHLPEDVTIACEIKQDTKWEGQKCINCTTPDDVSYFIKDGYCIGAEYPALGLKVVGEYKFSDTREDLIVPEICRDSGSSLPAQAFNAPSEVSYCKSEVKDIKLQEPPCSFGIKYNETEATYFVKTGFYKRYGLSELCVEMEEDEPSEFSMVRGDIYEDGEPLSVLFVEAKLGDTCYDVDWGSTSLLQFELAPVGFSEVLSCDITSDASWNGKKCTNCTVVVSGVVVSYFVKDGLMIGGVVPALGNSISLEYVFEDFRQDIFLNSTCEGEYSPVPPAAYKPPNETSKCGHNLKGDGGSTVSVVSAVIISMMMITLISLF